MWCQKFLELSSNIVDVVYMDEVGLNLHLTCHLEGLVADKHANEFVQLKGLKLVFGGYN